MLVLELYCMSVVAYYACCTALLMTIRSTVSYSRNKDIKNACTNLEAKVKSSALKWGPIWPLWIAKLWLRK